MEEFLTFDFAEIALSDNKSAQDASRENTTRPAVTEATYVSTGTGQHRIKPVVAFPVVFRDAPHFTSGCGVTTNPGSGVWHDPVGLCGVYGWQRDDRGYYTGAFIWVRVEAYPIDADNTADPPAMIVTHYLTFTGRAVKDLRTYKNAATLASLTPRTVGV